VTARDQRPAVFCPVPDCLGLVSDHRSVNAAENLHTQPGKEWPLPSTFVWPLEIALTMDETSWPYWRLNVDVPHTGEDLTAIQVGYIAAELHLNAIYVAELNRMIEGDH
jgi:hypothetical protein